MAINFPDSPTNGESATLGGNTWTYNSTSGAWARASSGGGSSITTYDSTTDLPLSGVSAGDQAFVTGSNRMYVSNGTGWYSVSLVNTNPNITSVQDSDGGATPFTLATDGAGTVITVTASDPEDVPLTYNYSVTSGSLTNGGGTTATVVQGTDSDVNKFTITPTTTEAYEGTFELTFTASDGINQGTSANSFTLSFVTIIANSNYSTLLATAVDTSDNNNITDASSNNHSITVSGDAHAGTFSPYRSGGYSGLFDSTSVVQLSFAGSSDFEFGTGNFTIEMWFKWNSSNKPETSIFSNRISGSTFNTGKYFLKLMPGDTTSGGIEFAFDCGTPRYRLYCVGNLTADNAFFDEGWHHYAAVRNGTSLKLFVDGQEVDEITLPANETNFGSSSDNIGLGINNIVTSPTGPDGEYRDVRIVKGVAITPPSGGPTEPLDAVSGTTLLLYNGEGYLKDKSTSNHSPIYGSTVPTITATGPYDYIEYSATDHGGSMHFDGSGDSLNTTATQIIPSSSFTVTAWVYLNDTTDGAVWGQGTAGHSGRTGITIDTNNWFAQIGSANLGTSTSVSANRWYYTDFQWDGSTLKFFVDGTLLGSVSNSNSPTNSAFYIGDLGSAWSTGFPLNGYVSDLKIVSGTPSGSSTVPTAPLSSTGAALHIKGADASIIDKSQGANLKLVGNTTGSTTQVKFADTKSIYIDGPNGDYISLPASDNYKLGTGDFTLETWVKVLLVSNDSGRRRLFNQVDTATSTTGQLELMVYPDGYFYVRSGSNIFATTTDFSDGSWYHLALVRHNSVLKVYVDGSLENSANNTTDFSPSAISPIIGRAASTAANSRFQGYIQDFRITKGLARYTSNFTPPTASLEG